MKKIEVVCLTLALSALTGVASAEGLKLSVGPADVEGVVRFTLNAHEEALTVEVAAAAMSATDKASAMRDAVAAQDPSAAWRADATGTSLTFEHLVGEEWQPIDTISDISDTTGGGAQLTSLGAAVAFNLNIAEDAIATGLDADGKPAFITVSVTDTLTWTHAISAGDTPEQLMDLFQAFLQDQAGEGVLLARPTATAIAVQLAYETSALNWQVTDTGLKPGAKAGGTTDAGVIDR